MILAYPFQLLPIILQNDRKLGIPTYPDNFINNIPAGAAERQQGKNIFVADLGGSSKVRLYAELPGAGCWLKRTNLIVLFNQSN